jgi:hypothetical protein
MALPVWPVLKSGPQHLGEDRYAVFRHICFLQNSLFVLPSLFLRLFAMFSSFILLFLAPVSSPLVFRTQYSTVPCSRPRVGFFACRRQRPLLGVESMMLLGMPPPTGASDWQLKDLAGNGFATTIVAAIVVAVFST